MRKWTAFGVGIFIAGVVFLGKVDTAHAVVNLIPDPPNTGTNGMPVHIEQFFRGCDNNAITPKFTQWISIAGNSSVTTIDVVPGQTSVNLQYNFAGVVCNAHPHTGVNATRKVPIGASAGVGNIIGENINLNFGGSWTTKGTLVRTVNTFTYAPPGGFTNGVRTVNFTSRVVNRFTSPGGTVFQCVGNPPSDIIIGGFNEYMRCGNLNTGLEIDINVLPPPNTAPTGNFVVSCNASGVISVTANVSDPQGGTLTATANVSGAGAPPSRSGSRNGNGAINLGTFQRTPNGATYTVSGNVRDSQGAQRAIPNRTVVCPRPASTQTCSAAVNPAGPFEVGQVFNIDITIRNTSNANALPISSSTDPIVITGSGLTGLGPAPTYGPLNAGQQVTVTDAGVSAANPGNYTVTITVGGVVCPMTSIPVGFKPYFKEFGGDVWVGGSFDSPSCTPPLNNSPGNIFAFNRGSGDSYAGASAQLTVTALLNINQFNSVSNRGGGSTLPPKGLTFANTDNSREYGGAFGANAGKCITDYYGDTRDSSIEHPGNWTGNNLPGPAGRRQYIRSSPVTIPALTVPIGRQAAVYVDGNVYISGNIVFAEGYGSIAQMPNFALIVRGNIYIASGVTRLDGTYIAQPSAAADSGTIYTCATAANTSCTAANVYAQGGNQLSVNGSLIANRIKLLRRNGTLRDAVFAETPNFQNGSGTGAAEVVNYTPQMYLAPSGMRTPSEPEGSEDSTGSSGPYDSIRNLPPVF